MQLLPGHSMQLGVQGRKQLLRRARVAAVGGTYRVRDPRAQRGIGRLIRIHQFHVVVSRDDKCACAVALPKILQISARRGNYRPLCAGAIFLQHRTQRLELDRFDQISVKSSVFGTTAIFRLTITGDGDQQCVVYFRQRT